MKLKTIVDNINAVIKSNLKQERFQKGIYYGLSKVALVKYDDSDEIVPMIYTDGKERRLSVDDTYPLNIYHRCVSISQTTAPKENQYGDGESVIKETCNILAVVYGKSEIVGLCQEDLASIITASFPSTMTVTYISNIIVRTNSVNNDSVAVYAQEYKSTSYPLNPEDYFFSIGYTVETTWDKACVDKCCN